MKILHSFFILVVTTGFLSTITYAGDPTGIWKWTAPGRNGQPVEATLKLAATKDGALTGSLADRSGVIPITAGTFKGDKLEFSVVHETPGGKIVTVYSGQLNDDAITGTSERPDPAPVAVVASKKRQINWTAQRVPSSVRS